MRADFTPIKNNYGELGQFRFWCQKVLPAVYDDSLSYYELLCKLVHYLNETMCVVELAGDDMDKLYTAYSELQDYVNTYFGNLNLQEEINYKLNVMASDGSLSALIQPLFDEYKNDINAVMVTQNEMLVNMSDTIRTQDNDIAVLEERMNSFTKLGEGSTTGDAELVDARVGFNGTVYVSAGEAIRAQVSMVNDKIGELGFEELTQLIDIISQENRVLTLADSGTLWTSAGTIVSNASTTYYRAINEVFDVTPNKTYIFKGLYGDQYTTGAIVVYDENMKNGITKSIGSDEYEYTIPDGYTKVAMYISMYKASSVNNIQILTGSGIGKYKSNDIVVSKDNLDFDLNEGANKPLKDKTIVNFGDSIFGQSRPPYDVSTFLAEETGAIVHNCGFGGCQMGEHAESKWDAFSMYRLVDAICSHDWSLQDSALTQNGLPDYFAETVTLLKSIDFSKVDIVTLGYGVNDFHNGISLRDSGDHTFLRFEYAMMYSIERLLSAYPNLRIFVCTMTYGFSTTDDTDTDTFEHTSWLGSGGTTKYTEWVEMQKEVAKKYKLPIIDNYYDLGINSVNKLQYFSSSDGVHHNKNGRVLIAKHMAKCLW